MPMLIPIEEDGSCQLGVAEVSDLIEMTVDHYKRVGFHRPWISYAAVRNNQLVGLAAFKSQPIDGRVEIAYFTVPELEGQGIATTNVGQLIRIAREADPDVVVVAQTLPHESASTSILKKHGFQLLGTVSHPEDGDVWEWELPKQ